MLKRIVCVLMIGLLLTTAAAAAGEEQEITFLDIPWLSDAETVVQTLREKGYIDDAFVVDWYLREERGFFFRREPTPKTREVILPEYDKYDAVQAELSVPSYEIRKKIAGYEVRGMDFAFIMDGDTRGLLGVRIELKIDDFEPSYADLKAKLTAIYGKGMYPNPYGWTSWHYGVWHAANDSFVVLMYDGGSISLFYGILSAEEMLQELYVKLPGTIDSTNLEGL